MESIGCVLKNMELGSMNLLKTFINFDPARFKFPKLFQISTSL